MENLFIESGHASVNKHDESLCGDSYYITKDGGKLTVVLSDESFLRCARRNSSHNIPDIPKYIQICTILSIFGIRLNSVVGGLKNDR